MDLGGKMPESECLHELFEGNVDQRPEALALICGGESLSYRELDIRANRLAHLLRLHGAGPGKFIGIYLERSVHPIVAILACLKAGAAYVPIDPAYPGERIRDILIESECILLITDFVLFARAAESYSGTVLNLDTLSEEIFKQSPDRIPSSVSGVTPQDLCYVIYTSGTTGRPKGIMTEHRNVIKFVHAFNEVCATGHDDRVFQGFSLTFDGSVEEIWMAYSNGSVLVVPNRESPRFGNELGKYLSENGVTYFSTVPTLLSTITDGVATLKLLIVSGEICPPELVQRFVNPQKNPGLRMLNVYGPTEATVNTTAAECIPGRPITIGRPLRGYGIQILDAEMRQVQAGEKGELFVGGETLARGYLKQPELSAQKFIQSPGDESGARLYRTGDLVRCNEEGELEFFGRIDSQVKIRGFRVELAEIESILIEHERIQSASIKLFEQNGIQELAAYIVAEGNPETLDRADILTRLESRLPAYMIPGFLDVLEDLPRLTSGKVDRGRLPPPVSPLLRIAQEFIEAKTELEKKVAQVWATLFKLPKVSVEDDFFLNLGGHSLVAAQMITTLRQKTGKHVTVRDAYNHPTVRRLAAHLVSVPERDSAAKSIRTKTRFLTTSMQAVSMYLLSSLSAIPVAMLFLMVYRWYQEVITGRRFIELFVCLTLLTGPALMALSIAAKWLIIGRYKPGKYPLWGAYFFRWWIVSRLQAFAGVGALGGTPLMAIYFRLMGAKVGKNCTLESGMCSIWDLVTIGEDTSIGADSQYTGYRVENGMLVIGRVDIGSRCFIGIHSALGLNVRMENDSSLDDQSLLPDNQIIAQGEGRRGSPAEKADLVLLSKDCLAKCEIRERTRGRRILYGLIHLVALELMALVFIPPVIPFIALWAVSFLKYGLMAGIGSLIATVPLSVLSTCLFIAGVKRLLLRKLKPGVYPVESLDYVHKWLSDGIMKMSRGVLLPLYTTIYFPSWLRLLGAKIGARAELSTVWNFSPELVEVGEESFFADGSIIGGKRLFRGRFEIAINRIGRRSFVGNSAILPVGASLGDGCLLGVQSIPPAGSPCTPDGTEWLGSPAFALPHRPKVGNFDASVTFRPTQLLYFQRGIIDALRILIPGYIGLSSAVLGLLTLFYTYINFGVVGIFVLAPVTGLALSLYATLLVVALKWLVMGRFKPVIRPLWSKYVWLNEMVNGAFESVMAPAIAPFMGTPFVAPLLRLMGCKIGKHTYIESILFSEFDLVDVGDYVALNAGSIIQTHLFEDRIMKSSHVKIDEGCSVGNMAVILYDSEMQKGAVLGPLSLLMKGETLTAGSRSHGIPTVQASDSPLLVPEIRERPTSVGLRRKVQMRVASVAAALSGLK